MNQQVNGGSKEEIQENLDLDDEGLLYSTEYWKDSCIQEAS